LLSLGLLLLTVPALASVNDVFVFSADQAGQMIVERESFVKLKKAYALCNKELGKCGAVNINLQKQVDEGKTALKSCDTTVTNQQTILEEQTKACDKQLKLVTPGIFTKTGWMLTGAGITGAILLIFKIVAAGALL
jgi:hypothetical protein